MPRKRFKRPKTLVEFFQSHGWTQNVLFTDKNGRYVEFQYVLPEFPQCDPSRVDSACLSGAAIFVDGESNGEYSRALAEVIGERYGGVHVTGWNDRRGRRRVDICRVARLTDQKVAERRASQTNKP